MFFLKENYVSFKSQAIFNKIIDFSKGLDITEDLQISLILEGTYTSASLLAIEQRSFAANA